MAVNVIGIAPPREMNWERVFPKTNNKSIDNICCRKNQGTFKEETQLSMAKA